MKSLDKLTTRFDEILQHDVEIKLGPKVIRRGTFILYTVKDFVITIHLKTDTANKQYDMFYPFDVRIDNKSITCDYTIENLMRRKNNDLYTCLQSVSCNNKSNKFLDQTLKINIV